MIAAAVTNTAAGAAERSVDEHRPADPQGEVEIIDVSGTILVQGWDRAEVEVVGTLAPDAARLEIASSGNRTSIHVVRAESAHWGLRLHDAGDARLTVHVPRGSSLAASLVSADLKVQDVQGEQRLQTVSGEVTSAAAGELHVHTVSGDVHLTVGADAGVLEVSTVSGEVALQGGHGEVSVSTVSGDAKLSLGTVTHAHFKSVSGDFEVVTGIASDGHIDAESVSGDIRIDFSGAAPPADFDLESFSGNLKTCFGQKAVHEQYGPGSRLAYREGAGSARVRINTNSGNVSLCANRVSGASDDAPDLLTHWLEQQLEVAAAAAHCCTDRGRCCHHVPARPSNCRLCINVDG